MSREFCAAIGFLQHFGILFEYFCVGHRGGNAGFEAFFWKAVRSVYGQEVVCFSYGVCAVNFFEHVRIREKLVAVAENSKRGLRYNSAHVRIRFFFDATELTYDTFGNRRFAQRRNLGGWQHAWIHHDLESCFFVERERVKRPERLGDDYADIFDVDDLPDFGERFFALEQFEFWRDDFFFTEIFFDKAPCRAVGRTIESVNVQNVIHLFFP